MVSEPSVNTERLMGALGIHTEKIKYDKQFLLLTEIFAAIKNLCFRKIFTAMFSL